MSIWRINDLLREFPETSVIEVNEIYSVPLRLSPTSQYTILINLPPAPGPNSPPILFCEPVIPGHSMIEKDGLVKLIDGMGIDGDLVSVIRKIIQLNPSNRNNSTTSTNSIDYCNYSDNVTFYHNHHNQQHNDPFFKFDLILIDSLTDDQVKNLLNDEEKFRKFLSNFNHIKEEKMSLIEEFRGNARQKAQNNLNLKKEIDALAAKLDETHEKYSETCQSYQNFLALNSSLLASLNPENILTEIQVNLMELNDSSNSSIKNALNSPETDNLDLVLKECVKYRKEYHSKAILLQKLQDQ